MKRAGVSELRAIDEELRRRSNKPHRSCISYIAKVLRAAGTPVELEGVAGHAAQDAYGDHHELREKGLLRLRDLEGALTALQKIDALYRRYRELSDRLGTSMTRELVAKGEARAMAMGRDSRLSPEKRREKREIAQWFRVWLEVPDLFFDWLEMRQNCSEFRRMFPRFNDRSVHHPGRRSFSI